MHRSRSAHTTTQYGSTTGMLLARTARLRHAAFVKQLVFRHCSCAVNKADRTEFQAETPGPLPTRSRYGYKYCFATCLSDLCLGRLTINKEATTSKTLSQKCCSITIQHVCESALKGVHCLQRCILAKVLACEKTSQLRTSCGLIFHK